MSPRMFWRRLILACRRERTGWRARPVGNPLIDKPRLAADLIESVSPSVLFEAGYLRRRRVRRVRYLRARGLR
jgi:hypothetical protein